MLKNMSDKYSHEDESHRIKRKENEQASELINNNSKKAKTNEIDKISHGHGRDRDYRDSRRSRRGLVITPKQWNEFISSPHFHYLAQTGVSLEYQGLGIASSLITLAKSHSIDGLCTNITYWPYNNIASEECKRKNGFECIGIWHQTICEHFVPFKAKIFIWRPIKSDLS
ncbi:unnamed protein product [Rotaria sp. Silwood1]|nr:unnamed protein product [Rotaria sp. Silwood1]CAF1595398.1 unnamed protein product [Rotaria sp. Silwood1]CAF3732768.1 unnamed protein product [Rotaria sp. Silwood1]CAF5110121.1 unnamed protein product [Rotaria sp. Silwood1]